MTTQKKWLRMLEQEIAKHEGVELIVNSEWANTGRISVESPDSFEPLISFSYNFQTGYCSFDSSNEASLKSQYVQTTGSLPQYPKLDEWMNRFRLVLADVLANAQID